MTGKVACVAKLGLFEKQSRPGHVVAQNKPLLCGLKETLMRLKLLPLLLMLTLLSACSEDFDLEFMYGTWVEPFDQSKSITFRENGTVDWLGEEGTFEASTVEGGGGSCHGSWWGQDVGRDCGNGGRMLTVTLPSKVMYGTEMRYFPRGFDGAIEIRHDPSNPNSNEYLYLYREGTLPQPLMPEPFEKLGEGWSPIGPVDAYLLEGEEIISSDPLVWLNHTGVWTSWVYDDTTDTWEESSPEADEADITGNKLYLKYPIADDYGYADGAYRYDFSLDKGQTWQTLPPLLVGEDLGSGMTLTGTTMVKLITVSENQHELWTIDAAAESPTWTLRKSLNAERPRLLVHPTKGTIVLGFVHNWDNEGNYKEYFDISGSKISHDYGQTWKDFDYFPPDHPANEDYRRCEGWHHVKFHSQGLLCNNGDAISWYDSTTHTWSMHEIEHDEFIDSIELPEGAYLRRGNQVLQWKPDGTETLLVNLPSHLNFAYSRGRVSVLDDQIIVNAFGIWRLWR
jgi:hypothetical protein